MCPSTTVRVAIPIIDDTNITGPPGRRCSVTPKPDSYRILRSTESTDKLDVHMALLRRPGRDLRMTRKQPQLR